MNACEKRVDRTFSCRSYCTIYHSIQYINYYSSSSTFVTLNPLVLKFFMIIFYSPYPFRFPTYIYVLETYFKGHGCMSNSRQTSKDVYAFIKIHVHCIVKIYNKETLLFDSFFFLSVSGAWRSSTELNFTKIF